tara:strand:+ start:8819 stop:9760 length:942 start_codon:yes stop_codon:yes gene_type:complete
MYSLTSLRAFDLVARFGTFTEAARELNVSRPAVSKQIKNLEQHLCCQLVVRSRPKVVLTEEGRQLAAGLKQGFDLINTTAQRITERRARSNAIHVLVDRDFATSWLAERVGGFLIQNPGILVEVSAERNGFLRMDEDFSFRIFYGPAGAFASEVLEEEELCEWIDLPLCTQEYSAAHVSDGTLAPTTHFLIDSNYNPWETWFRRAKIPDPGQGTRRTSYNETSLCLSAALAGSGVTIGDSFMCLGAIAEGRLVAPFKLGLRSRERYWICRLKKRELTDAERLFQAWLAQEVVTYQRRVNQVFTDLNIEVLDAD